MIDLKRHKLKIGFVLLVLVWLILPSGDVSDFFVTIPLINLIGVKNFVLLAAVLLGAYVLWKDK